MHLPKMILFDYGETLAWEKEYDSLAAARAILPYATANPRGVTPEALADFSSALFQRVSQAFDTNVELHNRQLLRFQFEYLGLEFSLPMEALEYIIHDEANLGAPQPHIEELLAYLRGRGIRTGVISNIEFTENALKRRIKKLLGEHEFEFIIATSEYVFRKPDPFIFQLALRKAKLEPAEAWYCGDRFDADVQGAHAAGLHGVWYRPKDDSPLPACPHTRVRDWLELIAVLEGCE